MKKEIKIILGFFIVASILLLSFYLANRSVKDLEGQEGSAQEGIDQTETFHEMESLMQLMTEEEKESLGLDQDREFMVVSRDEDGEVDIYEKIFKEEIIEAPFDFMSNEEKESKGVNVEGTYQVLERDEEANVLAYRIIMSPEDIVTEYGQYVFVD